MYKDVFLAQVDSTINGKTDDDILAFPAEIKPELAKIENHRCKLTNEICPLTVVQRMSCCRLRAACIAVNLKSLNFLEVENE